MDTHSRHDFLSWGVVPDAVWKVSGDLFNSQQAAFAPDEALGWLLQGLRVAAKIMDAASAAEEEHKREIVAMAALQHPNVVGLSDVIFKAGRKKGTGQVRFRIKNEMMMQMK